MEKATAENVKLTLNPDRPLPDGDAVALPLTNAELRACFKRLRRAGLEAVMLNGMSAREKRQKELVAVAKK